MSYQPPSTLCIEPVMKEAPSLRRKQTNAATSSGLPHLDIAAMLTGGGVILLAAARRGVSMMPLHG